MSLSICAPPSYYARTITWCNSCGWNKRAIVEYHEWYEPDVTCCTCGHDPRDRGKVRPYKRGAIRAKELWKTAKTHKEAIADMVENIMPEETQS
jgi:hypothetical protein